MSEAYLKWIVGNDTGVSSKFIWAHMVNGSIDEENRPWLGRHPMDSDDFGRCYRLLTLVPSWRTRIGEMAKYSALVSAWDDLSADYERIADAAGRLPRWATLNQARRQILGILEMQIRGILDRARVCRECGAVGMSAWTVYPDKTMRCADCARQAGDRA